MPTTAADLVLDAAHQRAAALVARDTASLQRLLHPDLQWTTFRGDVLTREQYIAGNTAEGVVWRAQTLEDVAVVVVGDTAVLTALVVDDVTRNGQDGVLRLRLTQTWVRVDGNWQCLSGHAGPSV